MAVRIRLRRMGRKKQPHFRVVVADSASPRDGRFVESLGYYKPLSEPARLVLDLERVDYWIERGARPSNTVRSLVNKARKGGDGSLALGEPDVGAERAARQEALAAQRKADAQARAEREKAEAEAKRAATQAAAAAGEEARGSAEEAPAAGEGESAEGEEEAEETDEEKPAG